VETFLTFEPRAQAIRRINKEQALRVNDISRDRNPILFHFAMPCTASLCGNAERVTFFDNEQHRRDQKGKKTEHFN